MTHHVIVHILGLDNELLLIIRHPKTSFFWRINDTSTNDIIVESITLLPKCIWGLVMGFTQDIFSDEQFVLIAIISDTHST